MNGVQGTNEELMALLGKHDAEERSVAATVQMLRLLGVPSAEMQAAFVGGRQAHMQATLQAARLQAHAAIVTAAGNTAADGAPWPGLLPFLESLCRSIFTSLYQVLAQPCGYTAESCSWCVCTGWSRCLGTSAPHQRR